ncbi:MAG: nucleoside triphosphate pyrophosphohydrolase [Dehalococcoidia bacterium]|jgi:predicted house-cleaning noncanonical NTP pyrophosphatase (MazG superfamily)
MQFDKIVRDKVPDIIREKGGGFSSVQVEDCLAVVYLIKKLREEADEVAEANGNDVKMVEEMGDIYECLMAICDKININFEEVIKASGAKAMTNGGFNKNIILLWMSGEKF